MNPLRTIVLMKTDISGSTSRFRELLAADLQALLGEHRDFLSRYAGNHEGHIIKGAGDGHWLEFAGVTGAAKAAIEMQEELRLAQPNRGDDRIAIRIVIALGDIAVQDGDFIGDVFALATRVEDITPPDEIYLTAAARLALTSAEIQTALVGSVALKGFPEPMQVYRIEQRHRTRTITDAFILFSDLSGFGRMMDAGPDNATVERILDALDALARGSAQELGGTVERSTHSVLFSTAGTFGSPRNCRVHRANSWSARRTAYSSPPRSAMRCSALHRIIACGPSPYSRCLRP